MNHLITVVTKSYTNIHAGYKCIDIAKANAEHFIQAVPLPELVKLRSKNIYRTGQVRAAASVDAGIRYTTAVGCKDVFV